jgi:2-oxoglutarate ferredoxin oxidoreductase subunit gamma
MHHEIVISGFGGQGVILAGKMLIHACMLEDRFVSHIPSYGIEMRGGSANCALVVSDKHVGSPLVRHPSAAVLLSREAYDRYESEVAVDGIVIVNSSLITREPARKDIKTVHLPCDDIALGNGQPRSVNVAALGGLIEAVGVCERESFRASLEAAFKGKGSKAVDVNMAVLDAAMDHVKTNAR